MRFPIIRVKDKYSDSVRIIGANSHDTLYINSAGGISYYNLQNGDGTGDGYQFIGKKEDWDAFQQVEFVTFEELSKIYESEKAEAKKQDKLMREMVEKFIAAVKKQPTDGEEDN